MKKSNVAWCVFGLFMLTYLNTLVLHASNAVAFNNGAYVLPATPESYDSSRNYDTHDWIGESSIVLLYDYILGNNFIKYLYDDDFMLQRYFFVGTEIPDYIEKGLSFNIITKHDTLKNGNFKTGSHTLRYEVVEFNGVEVPTLKSKYQISQQLVIRANDMGNKASLALSGEKDCQKAAVFLGAMCHYITDAVYYGHLLDDTSSHIPLFTNIGYLTNKPYSERKLNGFFDHDEAYAFFSAFTKETPYQAAYKAGADTRYGNEYHSSFSPVYNYMDAVELNEYAPTIADSNFWPSGNSAARKAILAEWDDTTRLGFTGTKKNYFDTLYHNLNVAVYYCAAAMNQIISSSYIYCDGCEAGGGNNPLPPMGGKKASLDRWLGLTSLLITYSFLGLVTTAMAVGLPDKLAILLLLA